MKNDECLFKWCIEGAARTEKKNNKRNDQDNNGTTALKMNKTKEKPKPKKMVQSFQRLRHNNTLNFNHKSNSCEMELWNEN